MKAAGTLHFFVLIAVFGLFFGNAFARSVSICRTDINPLSDNYLFNRICPTDQMSEVLQQGDCGDGVPEPPEQCDDGDTDDLPNDLIDDGPCVIDLGVWECKTNICSDGYLNAQFEECDNAGAGGACNATTCMLEENVCGNSVLEGQEECDDGCLQGIPYVCEPEDDGDGCSSTCLIETISDVFEVKIESEDVFGVEEELAVTFVVLEFIEAGDTVDLTYSFGLAGGELLEIVLPVDIIGTLGSENRTVVNLPPVETTGSYVITAKIAPWPGELNTFNNRAQKYVTAIPQPQQLNIPEINYALVVIIGFIVAGLIRKNAQK